eukprot:2173-Rhodomonas_salina.2
MPQPRYQRSLHLWIPRRVTRCHHLERSQVHRSKIHRSNEHWSKHPGQTSIGQRARTLPSTLSACLFAFSMFLAITGRPTPQPQPQHPATHSSSHLSTRQHPQQQRLACHANAAQLARVGRGI